MSSVNKLSLKQFVKTEQSSIYLENDHRMSLSQQTQDKQPKNEKRQSLKQNKKIKLNTLPCESIQNQRESGETFLFRSTWEDDMQHFKQEIKGCSSPTFATEILSTGNNHSSLFHAHDYGNDQGQETMKKNRISNSRSKSKNSKSLQKFIGDHSSSHRPSNSMLQKGSRQNQQSDEHFTAGVEQQKYLYEINKLQSLNNDLKRENKKLDQKCQQLKEKCQLLQEKVKNKMQQNQSGSSLMSNEELLEKMRNQSFWKFYLKAEKMIRSSLVENNQQASTTPINFMKELQALRELTSEMKKENKSLKKMCEERGEQMQATKDKLSVQEAEIQEMRLKCVAYESSIKRLREQIVKYQKDSQKLGEIKELEAKLQIKNTEATNFLKQLSSLNQQLQQQKLLNSQCQKERLSTKKKCQQLNQEISSLNKQLSSLKTSYNLLEIEKQQLSANKKELIEKEKLKEKVYQLEKEINSLVLSREQEIAKLRVQYEAKFGKEIQCKDSRAKELDQKVEKIMASVDELQSQNTFYSQKNQKLTKQISQLREQNSELAEQITELQQNLSKIHEQKQQKLSQLSNQLKELTNKLNEQSNSLLSQQNLIRQLKQQIKQKEQILKIKEFESQKLKESLILIKQEEKTKECQQQKREDNQTSTQTQSLQEMEEYIARLQQKHNQALQMYEAVHNEKVQLELQVQYYEQQLKKQNTNIPNQAQNQQQLEEPLLMGGIQQTMQMIESLLTIKEQIIKKTLVFCPPDYKSLLVEYIYYGDMIKNKYLELITLQNNPQDIPYASENNCLTQDSYLQEQPDEYQQNVNYYMQDRTKRNNVSHETTSSRYNRTRPYQYPSNQNETQLNIRNSNFTCNQDLDSRQEEINSLLEQFMKIGKIIEEETKINQTQSKRNSTNQRKSNISSNQLREQDLRRSKQKENQQLRNLMNKKINSLKENNNQENFFHYKLANNEANNRPPAKNVKQFVNQQKAMLEKQGQNFRRDQTNQEVSQKSQYTISRPLFSSNNVNMNKPSMKTPMQEQSYPNKPYFYEQTKQTLRSTQGAGQQTPYQKQQRLKNNFNHGILSKLNILKMAERIQP